VSAPPSSTRALRILGPVFAGLGGLFLLSAALLALGLASRSAELWLLPLVFAGVGTPFALVGAGFLLVGARRSRTRHELQQRGRKLLATVVDVEPSLLRINRRRAHVLVVEVREPDAPPRLFRSEALLAERAAWLGRTVTVYVDARDARRYFVEVA
jgi:di/tricarboxylate transporter